jgi:hypothetical protein
MARKEGADHGKGIYFQVGRGHDVQKVKQYGPFRTQVATAQNNTKDPKPTRKSPKWKELERSKIRPKVGQAERKPRQQYPK